jgi:outer membrane receptor protein involved in Fe transport
MPKKKLQLILFLLTGMILFTSVHAQSRGGRPGGEIVGTVLEKQVQSPVEYAYVILYKSDDSTQVTGTITSNEGHFQFSKVMPGKYYIEIQFMGYQVSKISDIQINRNNRNINLGVIELEKSILETESIDIVAEKPAVTFKIDKKIINVDQQQTAASGTAVDVLENIPSVTVDIEGNVSLRGSESFVVLIDNIPSILEPNEILQQIPATTIENIEIITNPSAKYDPDGTSGIINIIMKKSKSAGINGIANLNVGLNEKYGADFLIYYRLNGYNFYFGADYNKRNSPGERRNENQTLQNDTLSYLFSDGESSRGRNYYSIRSGIEMKLAETDFLNLGLRYGYRSRIGTSEFDYDQWTIPGNIHYLYKSDEESERSGDFLSGNINYVHKFSDDGHELMAQLNFRKRDSNEESLNELFDDSGQITNGQKTTEKGPSQGIRAKLEYVLPLNKKSKFEAGYQNRIGRSEDITGFSEYDPIQSKYIEDTQFSNSIEYQRDIHSLYSLYAAERGAFGCQVGLRGEYTFRLIELMKTAEAFSIDRWDYFPTAHFSYQFVQGKQMMVSYTKRIERPRGWYLEPFETWSDAYNVRVGNPDLKPEYIDSYELGYQSYFGKNVFSVESYYRITNNKIERVRSVYSPNVTLHSTANVGKDYTFGAELMFNIDLIEWWNVNLMGNIYNYKVEGILNNNSFARESNSWGTRVNNTIRITPSTRLQLNAMYNSPRVSSQGEREGFFATNVSVRQEFFNRQLSATLQIRDVFSTAKHNSISEGVNFYYESYRKREAPIVMLNISYKFNDYEQERKNRDRNQNDNDEEEDF